MKKWIYRLFSISLLALTNQALAALPTYGNGMYAGAGLGYQSFVLKKDVNVIGFGKVDWKPEEGGLIGNAFFGYGKRFNHFYLGGEIVRTLGGNEIVTSTNPAFQPADLKEEIKDTLAVDLRPGYFASNNVLIYGLVGIARSEFKSTSPNTINSGPGIFGTSGDFSKHIYGGQIGIGAEVYINKLISLRGEYRYTRYESFKETSFSQALNNLVTVDYKPVTNDFNIVVSFHFG